MMKFRSLVLGVMTSVCLSVSVIPAQAFNPDYVPSDITDANLQNLWKLYSYMDYMTVCYAIGVFNNQLVVSLKNIKDNYELMDSNLYPKSTFDQLWARVGAEVIPRVQASFSKLPHKVVRDTCHKGLLYGIVTYNLGHDMSKQDGE